MSRRVDRCGGRGTANYVKSVLVSFFWDTVVLFLRDCLPCVGNADWQDDDMFFFVSLNENAGPLCVAINDGDARFSVPDPENEVPFTSLKCGNYFNACLFMQLRWGGQLPRHGARV